VKQVQTNPYAAPFNIMKNAALGTTRIVLIGTDTANTEKYEFISHPKHELVTLHGRRLKPGDQIVRDTYFSAPDGLWKKVHPDMAGMIIGENPRDIYVHPSPTPFAQAPKNYSARL
jgi:hypothetical protein